MKFEILCSRCQQKLEVDQSMAGLQVRCPQCEHVQAVPQPLDSPESAGPLDDLFPSSGDTSNYGSPAGSGNPYSTPEETPTINAASGQNDTAGILGVVFGVLGLFCGTFLGFCCGPFVFVGILLSVVGLILSFSGQEPLRTIGIALNGVALAIEGLIFLMTFASFAFAIFSAM